MYLEVLTDKGKELLPFFRQLSGYYLVGGTALALQIGHRVSIDFDFFSNKPLEDTLFVKVEKIFAGKKLEISVNNADELTVFIDGIKVSIIYYPFGLLLPLLDFENMSMASAKEIGAMKAYTVGRRGNFKDYVDLYYILSEGVDTIEGIISSAERKYKDVFNTRLFLEQLVYFKDLQGMELKFLKKQVTLKDLDIFFQNEVKKIEL